jgi:hypothetical protein
MTSTSYNVANYARHASQWSIMSVKVKVKHTVKRKATRVNILRWF